uniref:F-box domain-containing protein n=1 Tax=Caenorhabditis tropicalis TaxID=1561998 RepID=A0A1I7TGQ3_9PELO
MTDFLENIVEETENLKIEEPKFEKWNELPSEIKLGCMKTLDFKTSSRTNRFIRIRTNNEEKHILLQLGTSTFGKLNGTEEFLRMSIISSQQSEVDTSEKWVRKLAETSDNEASFDEEDYDSSDDFDYYDYIYRPEEYYNDNCW